MDSPRCPGGIPGEKSWGMVGPLYVDIKVIKYLGGEGPVWWECDFCVFLLAFARLQASRIGAKGIKLRQKRARAPFTLLWSCLRLKLGVERPVHMCRFCQNRLEMNSFYTVKRSGDRRRTKNCQSSLIARNRTCGPAADLEDAFPHLENGAKPFKNT